MPYGRGWFGWGGTGFGRGMGMGFGRGMGMGFGRGMGMGFGRGMGMGRGMGRGNPYPFCRNFPWLPRRWWAYGGGYNPTALPGGYGQDPYYGAGAPYPQW
jgi:hypothetical protein